MKRILIVDGSVERCLAVSDFLGGYGFETGVADTSERALRMLAEADPIPDFILLDIRSENVNNWFFYDQLKRTASTCNIPIILMNEESSTTEIELDNKFNAPPGAAGCLLQIMEQMN